MKLIIDTDPGTDDAIAIMMALAEPGVDLLGLTTVGGNGRLADSTRNALRLLEHLGRPDVPVHAGASRPTRGAFRYGYYYHGPAALGVRLPSPRGRAQEPRAAEYIVDTLRQHPGEVTIAALGPLTNVAEAIRREPKAARWAREIVVMGAALGGAGNVTPYAEFNTYNDPEAAAYVFDSDANTTLVDLDLCAKVRFRRGEEAELGASPAERLARRILESWFALHPETDTYTLCDPLAVLAALRPELFSFENATIAVDVSDGETRGKTSAVYGEGGVSVATGIDAGDARQAVLDLLRASRIVANPRLRRHHTAGRCTTTIGDIEK